MKYLILTSLLILYFFIGNTQNLVPNPDFEDYNKCPEDFIPLPQKKLITDWYIPNKGTPDYFNKCSKEKAGIPENFAGKQYPHSGDAYIGMILREYFIEYRLNSGSTKDIYREYAQAKLIKELEAGKTYCVKLHYCLAKYSKYAIDRLGISFTSDKVSAKNKEKIWVSAQIYNTPGKIMKDKTRWNVLCDTYTAQGGEQYITIGNFWLNDETAFEIMDMTNKKKIDNLAYYLIDDVSVVEVENETECPCAKKHSYVEETHEEKSETNEFEHIEIGESVILNNIFFDIDKAELLPESYKELNKLIELLKKYPKMEIEISGHTSNTGSADHNQDLSQRRAAAVKKYICDKDIRSERLTAIGYGLTIPIASNDNKEGRSKNRRVEFKILKK